MKKEIDVEIKIVMIFFVSLLILVLIISTVSAGFLENIKGRLTGRVTQNVDLNITVGIPVIIRVYNETISLGSGPNEGPTTTIININFSVSNSAGAGSLNHTSARVNVTNGTSGYVRTSTSCINSISTGNFANYTCNVTMFWYDPQGPWTINAYIEDNFTSSAVNSSLTFPVGTRTAFNLGPASLAWPGLSPGSTNRTSNNDPLLLNNTGNDIINAGNLTINASNLRGEVDNSTAIWSNNISVHWLTNVSSCIGPECLECEGTIMNRTFYEPVTGANLSAGNYTINDGDTGQEELYFCLKLIGSELTEQSYSTSDSGEWSWVVQII